jgi:cytochrome c551/c552
MRIPKNRLAKIGGGLVILFLLLQIPPSFFETNPPVKAEPQWDSAQTRTLAQRACFDCHSNETDWGWYTRIAPSSYLVLFDVIRGRGHLNFSEWNSTAQSGEGRERRNSLREVDEQVNSGAMPPWYYLLLHPQANLSAAEKQQLIQGLRATH